VMIGLLLCGAAGVMMNESRKLLVGEGMERATLDTIRRIAVADPAVSRVGRLLTLYLGPEEVMLVMESAPSTRASSACSTTPRPRRTPARR
jgi:divalent metal cation (Fe/Co/Zn/Cd) transporter